MILLAATASTMFAALPAAGATLPPKPSLESFPRASFSCEVEGHPDVLATVDIDPPARAVTFWVTFYHPSSVRWDTGRLILGRMGKPLFFDGNGPHVSFLCQRVGWQRPLPARTEREGSLSYEEE